MLAKELLSKPDGFIFAINGEEEYIVNAIRRKPTHANWDDTVMHWSLELNKSNGNIGGTR